MNRLIIGTQGKKRHGKDTCAEELVGLLQDYNPVIIHFADALYIEVAKITGVGILHIKNHKDLFRPMLQWWGTEFRRIWQNNDNYWVDQVRIKIANLTPKHRVVIIPDVRFQNEVKFVREYQHNLIIKVERKFASPLLEDSDSHSSETSLDNISIDDFVITNDTLEKFKARIKAAKELFIDPKLNTLNK